MSKSKLISIISLIVAATAVFLGLRYLGFLGDTATVQRGRAVTTDSIIQDLETRLQSQGENADTLIALSDAYLQKIRENADTALYDKVLSLTDRAEKIDPKNPDIFTIRAIVAGGRHDFKTALSLGQKALQIDPSTARRYGIVSDAQIELGMYKEAAATLQIMVNRRPDFNSYSRIAHIRELYGDIPGAIKAMEDTISAASAFPENIAWSYVELGKLQYISDPAAAKKSFANALFVLPKYPKAYQWLARVDFAEGNLKEAINNAQQAFDLLPLAEYATDLGDYYALSGDTVKAEQYYKLVEIGYTQFEKTGVNVDPELSFFLSNRNRNLDLALGKARSAYEKRPNIYSADALAWAFYKKGNLNQAQKYSTISRKLGTKDPLLAYHAGVIALTQKNTSQGRDLVQKAINQNPNFSILDKKAALDLLAKK